MRNYLLASAALLGLVAGGVAQAATFAETDASRNASAFGSPQTKPAPGKIIVHMGGLIAVDGVFANQTSDKSSTTTAKNSPYGMGGYFRLYFGVDGKLANGLIYGGKSEMRTNFAGGQAATYTGTATLNNSSSNSTGSLWYTRRAYGYVGGDSWGIVRIGQGDGPISLFTGGGITTGEAYSTGQWDGDACTIIGPGCPGWAFLDVGNEYVSNKITWVSPSWGGLQLGASYAPDSVGLWANGGNTAYAGGNPQQQTSNLASDMKRPKDMIEVAARWQGNLGPVAVDAMAGYLASNTVKGTAAGIAGLPAGVTGYKGLSVYDAGLSFTYMGASVFGHINGGKSDGAATPMATLTVRKKDQFVFDVGAQYSTGPYTVGASYYQFNHQGAASGTGNRVDQGMSVGGQYTVTPGFDVFAEYLWGKVAQNGVNFVDSNGAATANNKITTSMVILTGLWRW